MSKVSASGLLIVHGIGNQSGGALRDMVAARLADPGHSPASAGPSGRQALAASDIHEVRVNGAPVLVYESNWADVSYPDNPPRVRDSRDVVTGFYRTVRAAWNSAIRLSPGEQAAAGADPKPILVWLAIAVLLNALLLILRQLDVSPDNLRAALNESDWFLLVLGVVFAALCICSVVQSARKRGIRRRGMQPRHRAGMLLQLPVVMARGFYRPAFLLLGAEMLFFLSIAVFTVYPVNLLGWLLTYPFRGAGKFIQHLGMIRLAKWIHRLGSVMVVLPTHSYLQAIKATGNLFAILFSEQGAVVRLNAVLWFVWVFFGFLALLLLSEFLLLFPLVMFLPDGESGGAGIPVYPDAVFIYFVVILPLYLLLLETLLPAIDLVLDVSNYHLASRGEREEYFEHLDRGVSELSRRGCRRIHLLAHSLGSVIAHDWLAAGKPEPLPPVILHTIGSPLDKFWYIDHGQPGRDPGRDVLNGGGAVEAWSNYWAYSDPVSGKLHRYDRPSHCVNNIRLRWLGPYLWSHGWYWTNDRVIRSLRSSLPPPPRAPGS